VGKGVSAGVSGITGGLGEGVEKLGKGDVIGGLGSTVSGVVGGGVGGLLGGVLRGKNVDEEGEGED